MRRGVGWGKWSSVRVLGQGTRGEEGRGRGPPFVCKCGRVLWVPGGGGRGAYSRLPVNNARGECFMARAGLWFLLLRVWAPQLLRFPRKSVRPPPQPPGKPRTTRLRPYPASATTFAVSPAGKCVTNQLMIKLCELKNNNNKKTRCEFRCIKDITNE